jgi:hypothetical protein
MRRVLIILLALLIFSPIETASAWYRLPSSTVRQRSYTPRRISRRIVRRNVRTRVSKLSSRTRRIMSRIKRRSINVTTSHLPLRIAPRSPPVLNTVEGLPAPRSSYDPLPDSSARAQFLLLGQLSPIIGAARVFIEQEPLNVTAIKVVVTDAVAGLQSFVLYDSHGKQLGVATLDSSDSGNRTYTLNLKTGDVQISKAQTFKLYARARLAPHNSAGVSGETVQISAFHVLGDGGWSNNAYSKATTETFSTFQTARSTITDIKNSHTTQGVLSSGNGRLLGSFTFTGKTDSGDADLRVTDLTFQITQAGGVTLSNVYMRRDSTGTNIDCTVSSSEVTCSSIDALLGTFRSGPATFLVYGDVTVPANLTNASLSLVLNAPGNTSSAGAVSWSDGTSNFSWVPFNQPVVQGTIWRY